MLFLRIEPSSASPIYRQMTEQIRDQIVSGQLKAGQQMPSVRQLAEELAVNQNTILKVYNELCREGLLKMERGSGTFVADIDPVRKTSECRQIISQILGQAVEKGRNMNINIETMEELLRKEYQKQTGEPR
jgi:GntR family transcriptional regulator